MTTPVTTAGTTATFNEVASRMRCILMNVGIRAINKNLSSLNLETAKLSSRWLNRTGAGPDEVKLSNWNLVTILDALIVKYFTPRTETSTTIDLKSRSQEIQTIVSQRTTIRRLERWFKWTLVVRLEVILLIIGAWTRLVGYKLRLECAVSQTKKKAKQKPMFTKGCKRFENEWCSKTILIDTLSSSY